MTEFTAEEIARCVEAMAKPAPLDALRMIASGRLVVQLTHDRRDLLVAAWDGKLPRDPDHPDDPSRRMFLSGGWPLYRAGMIDAGGVVTDAGRALLAERAAQ